MSAPEVSDRRPDGRGGTMHTMKWVALAALVAGCATGQERSDRVLLEQGRLYTTWLYGSEYEKLWDRFSPEMRQSFGSVHDLASFAGRAVGRLGRERTVVDERVETGQPLRVYRRSASFDKAARPMRLEWSLGEDGTVTGLLLQPDPGAQ